MRQAGGAPRRVPRSAPSCTSATTSSGVMARSSATCAGVRKSPTSSFDMLPLCGRSGRPRAPVDNFRGGCGISASISCMSSSSRAPRGRRPAWLVVRLAIGIVLVLASVAGVWFIVHAARVTEPALAASRPLVPGQTVTAAAVVELEVRPGGAPGGSLTPAGLEGGLVATRVIDSGELLARGAVDEADVVDATTVVVRSALDVPEVVERGSTVELWAAPLVAPGEHGEPESIVASATIDSGSP